MPRWHRVSLAYTPERIGLLTMLCVVVAFGVHSFIDWTWYIPGNACVALLFAGWLAGRGPLRLGRAGPPAGRDPSGDGETSRPAWAPALLVPRLAEVGRLRLGVALAAIVVAVLAAWSQWQPQRSEDARQQALALVGSDPRGALATAHAAVDRDPLSVQALFALSAVQQAAGQPARAQATLQRAVRLQPSNPESWLHLGLYEIHGNPHAALSDIEAAIFLDPQSVAPELISGPRASSRSIEIQNAYIQALRASAPPSSAIRSATSPPARAGGVAPRAAPRRRAPRPPGSESPRAAP
jgi:hypothetical protein